MVSVYGRSGRSLLAESVLQWLDACGIQRALPGQLWPITNFAICSQVAVGAIRMTSAESIAAAVISVEASGRAHTGPGDSRAGS